MKYVAPEMEKHEISVEDVIATSSNYGGGTVLPEI